MRAHAHTHTHVRTRTHTHTHTHARTQAHIHMHASIHTHARTHAHVDLLSHLFDSQVCSVLDQSFHLVHTSTLGPSNDRWIHWTRHVAIPQRIVAHVPVLSVFSTLTHLQQIVVQTHSYSDTHWLAFTCKITGQNLRSGEKNQISLILIRGSLRRAWLFVDCHVVWRLEASGCSFVMGNINQTTQTALLKAINFTSALISPALAIAPALACSPYHSITATLGEDDFSGCKCGKSPETGNLCDSLDRCPSRRSTPFGHSCSVRSNDHDGISCVCTWALPRAQHPLAACCPVSCRMVDFLRVEDLK